MKKIKQKTTEQLHDEIMNLFIGQEMGTTLVALVETLVGVADHMEVQGTDLIRLVLEEQAIYEEMAELND